MGTYQDMTLPDGTIVEYACSPPQFPPGADNGQQRTNGPMPVWYRVNNGEWRRSGFKSLHTARQWLAACDSVDHVDNSLNGKWL